MKQRSLILSVFLLLGLYPQTAHGCSCSPPPSKEDQEKALAAPVNPEVKKFWAEQFNGAVFIGTVIRIEKVTVNWFDKPHRMKKVTVKVDRAWVGETGESFVIYTNLGKGGDCGVPYTKGQRYFFQAEIIGGLHWTNICFPWEPDTYRVKWFDKMFGQSHSSDVLNWSLYPHITQNMLKKSAESVDKEVEIKTPPPLRVAALRGLHYGKVDANG